MFQPKPSMRFLGVGLAILLLLSLAIAANWSVISHLSPFGSASADSFFEEMRVLEERVKERLSELEKK